MTTVKDAINPDERIVKVRETSGGNARVFYAIRDEHLGYWRSGSPIDGYDAWTRDVSQRAEFNTRSLAVQELKAIWRWRREAA